MALSAKSIGYRIPDASSNMAPRFSSPEESSVEKIRSPILKHSTMCLATLFCVFAVAALAAEQNVVLLWPNGAPGSEGKTGPEKVRMTPDGEHVISSVHQPSITVFLPSKETATGAAVVIAPGGSHVELWVDHEGFTVAQWLSEHGVAGFVLKYRLAREVGSTYTVEGNSLPDMQRAIRLVRSRAGEWDVDPARVGVMGFSAGGDVAARAATQFDAGNPNAADPVDRQGSKPAFQALIYPGLPPDLPVSKYEPPAFLLCGEDDRAGISEGLPELFVQLKHAGVPAELHVYTAVGHGFGVRSANTGAIAEWPDRFLEWLGTLGFLKRK
jgi:acetyl esterase/lipase